MQEFEELISLLKIEQEEDARQYKSQMVLSSLEDRQKSGRTWYPIKVNASEIGAGENYYISLEKTKDLDRNHAFQVGDMVALFNNSAKGKNQSISGTLSAVWKHNMRIAFNIDELPDWLDYGNLGVDLLFDTVSYQEMEKAMLRIAEAKNDRIADLRDIILGKKNFNFKNDIPEYFTQKDLNSSQNEAIKKILSAEDIAIIHGPPGTGKTTTLVQAIKMTLQREKQVLATAPSNTAVDLLTERLAKKGLKVLRIGNPARIDEELMQHSLEAQISQHADYKILKKLRKQSQDYIKMAHKYKRKFGKTEREQRKLLFIEAHKAKDDARNLENYIVNSLVNEAQVITATLVGSVNKYIRFKRFSTVFIDEAAQALEPATWIPILKAERVVLAGDHFQLPPTVKSYEAGKAGLETTLLEKLMEKPDISVLLNTQYRMNEKIMGFSNQMFYDNELEADFSVKNILIGTPEDEILGTALEFVDTAGCSFEEKTNPETQSKNNPDEAKVLFKHLEQLLNQIYYTDKSIFESDFGIGLISPYRSQVRLMRENLALNTDFAGFNEYIQAHTVDGFQGQERDVIYISLVRSNDKGKIGFLEDTRRMNVAMTRAKKKLVIIGDSATISQHNFYAKFLDYVEKNGVYRTAWEFMG